MLGGMSTVSLPTRSLPARRFALLLPLALLLGACAPTVSLNNIIDTTSPRRVGPLYIGQTWSLSGQLGATPVAKSLSVPRLVEVQDGSATVSVYDQDVAQRLPTGDFQLVSYTNSDQLKNITFIWTEAVPGGLNRYTCTAPYTGSNPVSGVLRVERPGDSSNLRGTCLATGTQPQPPAKPAQ
jgi:hypothetical protein